MDNARLGAFIAAIEEEISARLPALSGELRGVGDMMRYSLSSGGKRVRPLLTLLFCEAAGGDPAKALPFAAGVEFVHTYSLIHDDLPCMDNDDMRRGKPSAHKRFGEANALLSGDALLTHAFAAVSDGTKAGVSAENTVKAVRELSLLAGAPGMVGGQYIDLKYEGTDCAPDVLLQMDSLKTGALIEAACVLGLLAADADESLFAPTRRFARSLGLAFQIKDDLLEYEDENEHSDEINEKSTYITLFGAERAKALAADYTRQAVEAVSVFGTPGQTLSDFACALLKRNN